MNKAADRKRRRIIGVRLVQAQRQVTIGIVHDRDVTGLRRIHDHADLLMESPTPGLPAIADATSIRGTRCAR